MSKKKTGAELGVKKHNLKLEKKRGGGSFHYLQRKPLSSIWQGFLPEK